MKRTILILALLALWCIPARGQNSASGNISASSTNCTSVPSSCVWEQPLPPNAATTTINISGTFSATLLVEESNNGGTTWSTAATLSSAGTTTYSTNGFTDIRVRCSAYVSGTAVVAISTGLNTGPIGPAGPAGSGGGISSISSTPGTPGVTAVPITSGLKAEYRFLPTETAGTPIDYSGNNNNGTGCTSGGNCVTAGISVIANTGGLNFTRNGGVALPAALNSSLTIQLLIAPQTFIGMPIWGNGATAASTTGLELVGYQNQGDAPINGSNRVLSGIGTGGSQIGYFAQAPINGNVVITWVMDCIGGPNDAIWINETKAPAYGAFRCLGGTQTSGAFQLGGIPGSIFGAVTNFFGGNIYYAAFYNRVLAPQEITANAIYMQNAMAQRGVPNTVFNTTTTASQFIADGDSITNGAGNVPNTPYTNYITLLPAPGNGSGWQISNQGISGITMASLYAAGTTDVDPFYAPAAANNAVVIWGGTNDSGVNVPAEAAMSGYCRARRLVGWKCFVVSMVSRTGLDTYKNTLNTWIRANWPQFADGFIDMGASPTLGADGANSNLTWFITPGIHPTTGAITNLESPIIQRAIGRYYGNNDFSTATVYTSAATAAVATTAGSESTNTVTITFGATPANCQVGNSILLAGITPAAYNSPAGESWMILTRSATQITFFHPTSGLGAITVQGTGVCPQQQDVDKYIVLNFGAGNFSLQSCVGYTGQNLYIRNINAAGTTLVPFGSESITGPGTTTVAAATTAILQSQLVSSSAAGCNWVRLQ